MSTVQETSAQFDPWEIRACYESGALTGYRVVRYGPRGAVERGRTFTGGHDAKIQAATLAARLNGTLP